MFNNYINKPVGDLTKDEGGIIYCEYHGDVEKKYKKSTPGSETE